MSLSTTLCALQGLLARFASQAGLWQRAVKSMAELDALMSLAFAAQFGGDGAPMCRPTFVEPQSPGPEGSTGHVSTSAVHLAQDSASVFFLRICSFTEFASTAFWILALSWPSRLPVIPCIISCVMGFSAR